MDLMILPKVERAMRVVRTYLVECAENETWNDRHTAELNETIRSCVERIAIDRREARKPIDALRHAIGYVEEQAGSASKTWTKWRAFADDSADVRG